MPDNVKVEVNQPPVSGCQNTGSAVLDSLVNILMAQTLSPHSSVNELATNLKHIEALHKLLIELSQKEPGGLRAWGDTRFLSTGSPS